MQGGEGYQSPIICSCSWCSRSVPDKIKYDLEHVGEYQKLERRSKRTIFRVGARERIVKPEQITHEVLSLGLYDRPILYNRVRLTVRHPPNGPPKTKGDSFRMKVVGALLHDLGKTKDDWQAICEMVVTSPVQVREEFYDKDLREEVERSKEVQSFYYEDDSDPPEEVIRSVLTLDAVFLACFLGSIFYKPIEGSGFASSFQSVYETCTGSSYSFQKLLLTDIMKLENQIPMNLIWEAVKTITHLQNQKIAQSDRLVARSEGSDLSESIWSDIYTGLVEEYSGSIPGGLARPRVVHKKSRPHLLSFLRESTRSTFATPPQISLVEKWTFVLFLECSDYGRSCLFLLLDVVISAGQMLKGFLRFLRKGAEEENQPSSESIAQLKGGLNKIFLPTATQLMEAGIEFCGLERRSTNRRCGSFFGGVAGGYGDRKLKGVVFKVHPFSYKATLYLPTIRMMTGDTEMLWRNLVAFLDETGNYVDEMGYTTDEDSGVYTRGDSSDQTDVSRKGSDNFLAYLEFMDNLIDTEQDVAILNSGKRPVIVHHTLGSKKAVAAVFNTMLSNYTIRTPRGWCKLYQRINQHYENTTVRLIVHFKRTYLDHTRPWLFVSVVAAAILLFLTSIQTILTWLAFNQD